MSTSDEYALGEETQSSKPKSLCVIPARGGSRRIPRKNIRELCGRPMIAWTIDAALTCSSVMKTIVSTDDAETADIARQCGVDVPFVRDAAIADDYTPVSLAAFDALERLDPTGELYDYVVLLLPNCPLRTASDIDAAYAQFRQTQADAQVSLTRFGWQNPWWAMRRDESMRISMLFPDHIGTRSQDLPELFCPTGAVWWIKAEVLRKEKTFHIEGRCGFELPWQRGIDIDNEGDWLLAKHIMQARLSEERS